MVTPARLASVLMLFRGKVAAGFLKGPLHDAFMRRQ
jgi:hypothetical protein